MIDNDVLKARLESIEGIIFVDVEGDGYHYSITLVADIFVGKTRLMRQRFVYKYIDDWIKSGELHAIKIKTYSKDEWEKIHG